VPGGFGGDAAQQNVLVKIRVNVDAVWRYKPRTEQPGGVVGVLQPIAPPLDTDSTPRIALVRPTSRL